MERQVSRLVDRLPELLPPGGPALLHGDLWWGNVLWGSDGRPWLIDPSAHGGHPEEDLAMLGLFGAIPERTVRAYGEVRPLESGLARPGRPLPSRPAAGAHRAVRGRVPRPGRGRAPSLRLTGFGRPGPLGSMTARLGRERGGVSRAGPADQLAGDPFDLPIDADQEGAGCRGAVGVQGELFELPLPPVPLEDQSLVTEGAVVAWSGSTSPAGTDSGSSALIRESGRMVMGIDIGLSSAGLEPNRSRSACRAHGGEPGAQGHRWLERLRMWPSRVTCRWPRARRPTRRAG